MFWHADHLFWSTGLPVFDFSLKFEETILQILPSSSFILFASCAAFVLFALELVNLILRRLSDIRIETTYPAASLDFVAALAVVTVVYIQHGHAIRSSAVFGLYLAIGTLIDGTKSRSYFLRHLTASGAVAAATAAMRLVLLVLEEVPKTKLIIDPELRTISNGEATSGFFSRSLFVFLLPMLRSGYNGILVLDDLSDLGIEFAARGLLLTLSDHWPASLRTSANSLFIACCKTWKWALLIILIPRLCLTGFVYSQPFVMRAVITHIGQPYSDEMGGLIGATLTAFGGAALCRAISTHLKNRFIARVRGGLIAQLFDKSYRLKVSEAKKQAAITMMSADYESIAEGIPACVEIPFSIVESSLGIFFLSRFIKLSCFIVFIPLILAPILGHMIGRQTSSAVALWNGEIQKRVAKTSHVLSQLPAIKSLGLGPKMAQYIQRLRVDETRASRKYRVFQAVSLGTSVLVDHLTPVLVVAAGLFTHMFGYEIDPNILFPTLGVLTLAKEPLASLVTIYPRAMSMLACFERVQVFLCQDEHQDTRTVLQDLSESGHGTLITSCQYSTLEKAAGQMPLVMFRFEGVAIAPRGSDKPVLTNVDLCIEDGSVTAMFGPTSSGKTTFIQSLLGEAEIMAGRLSIDESVLRVALCGQDVFLPNTTVRDCIIGACNYDPVWFGIVLRCCKLEADLERLPNGQDYVIGSGGIGLSGGQRQRIGIARSVYARTKVTVFDDSFSALDKKTAMEVLMGLCGPDGLLRAQNCTVILAGYLPECLDVADSLLLLDGEGNITMENHQYKGKVKAQVACLLQQGLLGEKEHVSVEETETCESSEPLSDTPARPRGGVEGVDQRRQRGDMRLYMLWINAVGRVSVAVFMFLMLFVTASDAFPNIYMRLWIHFAPANNEYLIGYALIALFSGLLTCLGLSTMFIRLAPRASNRLHAKLITVTTQATIGFLTTTDSGSLLNRFSEDMELLSKRVPSKSYTTIYAFLGTVAHTAPIFAGTSYMVATLPVVVFCLFMIQRYYLRTSRQLRLLQIEAQAPLVTALRDIGTGIIYMRGFGTQEHHFARCLNLLDQSQKPYYHLLTSQAFLTLVLELVVTLMALVLAILALFVKDSTDSNAAGLAFLNLIFIGQGFTMAVNAWTGMETSVGSLARLRDFLRDTPMECKDGAVDLPTDWPSRGEVVFTNVTARYKLDDVTEQPAVLQGINFHVEPGKKIGIMGRTGSGKSSLLNTLLGFLEYDGSVTIDGVEIRSAHPDELRARIITISQDLVELDGTIRDNLLPYDKSWDKTTPSVGRGADQQQQQQQEADRRDEIVRETLVRLGIWEPLAGPGGGLDAVLDQVGYSHGDKQLLCIARAVVRRRLTGSKLVLVDEATASVDSWRDQIVREMMTEYFRGCTIIVVAHREETIADSNCTIHMAGGCCQSVDNYDSSSGW
ncbi:ABC transporter [Cordyceps fumosorosea ARSEF 2679]|uniref:ABC transporter n=1 Tax=Cordyceps fumosorosea (strain ARSEF 2679) TaxID=1081104 RepID=A0A167TNG1_CORFA|nr:ABC transporter [Cordyceps fumosorosea ARSEF 2679]OAA60779.1 ABC transporter [Cordyceps fumosorosea ARSEF 2679]